MTRKVTREIAVHFVYAQPFDGQPLQALLDNLADPEYYRRAAEEDALFVVPPDAVETDYLRRVVEGVALHALELDAYIEKYARGWAFGRISRVAAAIMRVAMFEVLYMPEIPDRVAINEAVEIAKKYEDPKTVSFINGVLGSFSRAELPDASEHIVAEPEETIEPPQAKAPGESP